MGSGLHPVWYLWTAIEVLQRVVSLAASVVDIAPAPESHVVQTNWRVVDVPTTRPRKPTTSTAWVSAAWVSAPTPAREREVLPIASTAWEREATTESSLLPRHVAAIISWPAEVLDVSPVLVEMHVGHEGVQRSPHLW